LPHRSQPLKNETELARTTLFSALVMRHARAIASGGDGFSRS
jgi:hypothetical protein